MHKNNLCYGIWWGCECKMKTNDNYKIMTIITGGTDNKKLSTKMVSIATRKLNNTIIWAQHLPLDITMQFRFHSAAAAASSSFLHCYTVRCELMYKSEHLDRFVLAIVLSLITRVCHNVISLRIISLVEPFIKVCFKLELEIYTENEKELHLIVPRNLPNQLSQLFNV